MMRFAFEGREGFPQTEADCPHRVRSATGARPFGRIAC
jgi:hypothetical protein